MSWVHIHFLRAIVTPHRQSGQRECADRPTACPLEGKLAPGETLRIWAMAEDLGEGGFNCGFDANIWNNRESDPAALLNFDGDEVSRY